MDQEKDEKLRENGQVVLDNNTEKKRILLLGKKLTQLLDQIQNTYKILFIQ